MVIVAHPDDADFGPAATAARWIDAGSAGWLVCCTSGDAGGEDPDADPLALAALREAEQRTAAAIVGYAGVTFLHQPDGALANDLVLRELLVREIRTFKPDVVMATDPEVIFGDDGGINHADHRAAGLAAVDAVYPAARNPMAFPWLARDGLAAHKVRRLYSSGRTADRLDRHQRHDRAQGRRATGPPSQIREPNASTSECGNGRPRKASRSRAAGEALRLIVIDEIPTTAGFGDERRGRDDLTAGRGDLRPGAT
jgi:LmbE family N-acetylglucosaminyl deacetylase